jgi:hypothetical protein
VGGEQVEDPAEEVLVGHVTVAAAVRGEDAGDGPVNEALGKATA